MTDSSPPAGADQQPVAMVEKGCLAWSHIPFDYSGPLFASPAAAPAVQTELTDEQVLALRSKYGWAKETLRAIEREVRSLLAASPTQAGEQPTPSPIQEPELLEVGTVVLNPRGKALNITGWIALDAADVAAGYRTAKAFVRAPSTEAVQGEGKQQ